MKKLFRTSRASSAAADAAPDPAGYASPPAPAAHAHGTRDMLPHVPSKKSLASLIEDHSRKKQQNAVTPFPINVGQQQQPQHTPTPYSGPVQVLYGGASPPVAPPAPAQHGRPRAPTLQEPSSYGASNEWSVPPPHRQSNGPDPSPPNPNVTYYLPPGARPADPAAVLREGRDGRPLTPPRDARARARDSQTSLSAGHGLDDPAYGGYVDGRSRGYSSASHGSASQSRGSDTEGANGFGGSVPTGAGYLAGPPLPPKPSKSPIPTRSPLAFEPTSYPALLSSSGPAYLAATPANILSTVAWADAEEAPKEKERRRFWWDRRKGFGAAVDEDTPRQSVDESREGSVTGHESRSGHGHGHGGGIGSLGAISANGTVIGGVGVEDGARDVTTAIRFLCAAADPPIDQIYRICDGVNHSETPESVGKEAARCLRKELKAGGDGQRRIAARTWLVMMQNVGTKGFRQHASSKKFLSVLEPLLVGPTRQQASPPTRRMLIDIIGHLAYHFGADKGCEALVETWRKVKMPQDPDAGVELPADHPAYSTSLMSSSLAGHLAVGSSPPSSREPSRPPSQPTAAYMRAQSPNHFGPTYAHLLDHNEDIRRLVNECNSAKETARLLHESLVYTKPEELEYKPVIKEFYTKCFAAHDSLTSAMGWAQSEAARSRQQPETDDARNGDGQTAEERALALVFEAHHSLAEVLREHDELEKMARDERELREVQERSKTDTRMARNDYAHDALAPPGPVASSSRTPSPVHAPLPLPKTAFSASPNTIPIPIPEPHRSAHPVAHRTIDRSRTPSPDSRPRTGASPSRAGSPLGLGRLRMGPRPLPNPFRSAQPTHSSQSLPGSVPGTGRNTPAPANGPPAQPAQHGALGIHVPPTDYARSNSSGQQSRGGSGSTNDTHASSGAGALGEGEGEGEGSDDEAPRTRPSRKALGKRRAVPAHEDADAPFDPNDIWGLPRADPPPTEASAVLTSAVDDDDAVSFTAHRPVRYAYDAYQEKLDREAREGRERAGQGGSRRADG
ncbi:hypothetical protein Q5752_002620 [Cryptotrichosporon argae]